MSSRQVAAGPSWLDSLARRAARGEVAPASVPGRAPSGGEHGMSRRTVLRTAAAAALLTGPLRLLIPAPARAATTTIVVCIGDSNSLAYAVFQECVRQPASANDLYNQAIRSATEQLATATGAKRQRLLKIIDRSTKGAADALKKIEDCNFKWHEARTVGDNGCRQAAAAGGSGGSGGSGGANSLCTPGDEFQCGDTCCRSTGTIGCCLCPKTASYTCCSSVSAYGPCSCCG